MKGRDVPLRIRGFSEKQICAGGRQKKAAHSHCGLYTAWKRCDYWMPSQTMVTLNFTPLES